MRKTSALPDFHLLPLTERRALLANWGLSPADLEALGKHGALDLETAGRMIENVVGTLQLPLGIATNFLINGREMLVPMALEEPSVIAAASHAAKLCRPSGFRASADQPLMIGQVQLVRVPDPGKAQQAILGRKEEALSLANRPDSTLVQHGGGLKDIETRLLQSPRGPMLVVHMLIDTRDAMGANAVNTIAERLSPLLEEASGGKARLRILSNLADRRLARAEAVWTYQALEESLPGLRGEEIVDAILDAYAFAQADRYRAATHNKGIMNGIDAVALATGNDFRALEAGAHTYAQGRPLTHYEKVQEGLRGSIELPLAVGILGGSIKTNPIPQISLKLLGIRSASELAEAMACVGLANNLAALRALATEGIQEGHLKLHAKNIALAAGAQGKDIEAVSQRMTAENAVSSSRASQILAELRQKDK